MPAIDFAELRRQVRLDQVLDVLGFEAVTRGGPQLRGPCLVHGSTRPRSRVFAAHLERHVWHCFRCGASGNALDLWVKVTRQPIYPAALELCRRLGLEVPWLRYPGRGTRSERREQRGPN